MDLFSGCVPETLIFPRAQQDNSFVVSLSNIPPETDHFHFSTSTDVVQRQRNPPPVVLLFDVSPSFTPNKCQMSYHRTDKLDDLVGISPSYFLFLSFFLLLSYSLRQFLPFPSVFYGEPRDRKARERNVRILEFKTPMGGGQEVHPVIQLLFFLFLFLCSPLPFCPRLPSVLLLNFRRYITRATRAAVSFCMDIARTVRGSL